MEKGIFSQTLVIYILRWDYLAYAAALTQCLWVNSVMLNDSSVK